VSGEWPFYARFRPIQQWPGNLTTEHRRSPFSASWTSTLKLLDRELTQLGADNVVIQVAVTERDLRQDGYPKANARPAHPGVIVALDSAYGPLSYPCDTFYDWRDNLRAIALALEALRAVDRYGVTKRGEQYTGWKQLAAGPTVPVMTRDEAGQLIGDAIGYTTDAILALWPQGGWFYREAARQLHPDAGGTAEDFRRLQEAKRVLDGA
jgi:hypothetical protein